MKKNIEMLDFGQLPDGRPTHLYRMTNASGSVAELTDYGARLVRVMVPDSSGNITSVVKGYSSIEGYLQDDAYLGAICGRFANRIANAQFVAEGETYQLNANNGANSLHGGPTGFHNQLWTLEHADEDEVFLTYHSIDGEEGFPGNVRVELRYFWSETNELSISVNATTDKTCPINLTNHAYFNLEGKGLVMDHSMCIHASRYIPIQPDAIPTGELRLVGGTPFDFVEPKRIGQDLNASDEQIKNGTGYDHCFVINKDEFGDLALAAEVSAPVSGIGLRVFTTLPGLQFYSGNFLSGAVESHEGVIYQPHQAFCLEPEFFPDSPNQSGFPNCLLRPEETFEHLMIFQFFNAKELNRP